MSCDDTLSSTIADISSTEKMIPANAAARGVFSDLRPAATLPHFPGHGHPPFTAGWPRSLVAAPGGSPLMTSASATTRDNCPVTA